MATQNYPDVGTLEQAAQYRTGVPTRLLNVLTGGLAGAISGSTEKAQEAASARRALLEEDLMLKRMKAQRQIMLEDELKIIAERDKAASATRAKEFAEKREAQRPTLIGQLRSRPNYQLGGSMAMPIPALEPIESLEEQASYEKAQQEKEDEEKKRKSGYMQYNVGGRIIGGTPDQIAAMAKQDPVLEKFIQEGPPGEPPFTTSWSRDPLTGQPTVRLNFGFNPKTGKSFTYEEQKQITDQYFGGQSSQFPTPPDPTGTNAEGETQPFDVSGYRLLGVKPGGNRKM